MSIIFLVISAKYRYLKYTENCNDIIDTNLFSSNIDTGETAYKTRVYNLLKCETSNSIARKNSLLWRIYLKSLLDVQKDFEKSRNALFAALDECPWNKVEIIFSLRNYFLFHCFLTDRHCIWMALFTFHKNFHTFKI